MIPSGSPRIAFYSSQWTQGDKINFGASDWWRLAVPAQALANHGWDVCLARSIARAKDGTLLVQDPTGRWRDDRQIIVWQRWMGEGADKDIRTARATGQVVINDVDDYYWAVPVGHEARRGTDPARRPMYNRAHYKKAIAASSLITVSTPWLASALSRWGPPVAVIPNYILLNGWRPRPPGKYIGWVGAVSWRGADLQQLIPSVVPWMRERGETFYHGGHMNNARSARSILGYDDVVVQPATSLDLYPQLWKPLKIGLVPLENSSFNSAKSWVKGLEASARGIPFIASDHPEYHRLGVGRLAKKPRDWVRHLEELRDPDLRAEEGKLNRLRAEQLSIEQHWGEWEDVYINALRELV